MFGGISSALGSITQSPLTGLGAAGVGVATGNPWLTMGGLGMMGQAGTNQAQKDLSREQMAFQERMSSSAYQRAMADMKKGGLNPILASKVGGASTPVGAMAQLQNPIQAGMQNISSAMDVKRTESQTDKIKQEISNLEVTQDLTQKQIEQVTATIKQIDEQAKKLAEETKGLSYDNAYKHIINQYYQEENLIALANQLGIKEGKIAAVLKHFGAEAVTPTKTSTGGQSNKNRRRVKPSSTGSKPKGGGQMNRRMRRKTW